MFWIYCIQTGFRTSGHAEDTGSDEQFPSVYFEYFRCDVYSMCAQQTFCSFIVIFNSRHVCMYISLKVKSIAFDITLLTALFPVLSRALYILTPALFWSLYDQSRLPGEYTANCHISSVALAFVERFWVRCRIEYLKL